MDLHDIRRLVSGRSPRYQDIATNCLEAMLMRQGQGEHAELLCYYAEATLRLDRTPARAEACIRYARQASVLAYSKNIFLPAVVVRASCFAIRLLAQSGAELAPLGKELDVLTKHTQNRWAVALGKEAQARAIQQIAAARDVLTTEANRRS